MVNTPVDRKVAVAVSGISLVALGLLSLVYGDLLLQWQPAPKDAAWRTPLAWCSGVLLLAAGIGLFVRHLRRLSALLGALWIALWVFGLHLPVIIATQGSVAALLGLAECSAMALGLFVLALPPEARRFKRVLIALFGACAVIFGLSHFVYAEFTASMVPAWVPSHVGVAYVTGAIHVLAGVCMLIGVAMPLAAWVETAMMASFVVLLHVPRALAAPTSRLELTMLAIATMLTGASWIVAAATRGGFRVRRDDRSLVPVTL